MGRLYNIINSARPFSWIKTIFIMLLGSYFALNSFPPLLQFLMGFVIIGPLLWGGLYVLNDYTDLKVDQYHKDKKERPIAKGKISKRQALTAALSLITTALVLASFINLLFFLSVALMVASQVAYTVKPFRFKERAAVGFILPSILNPVLRFYAGWFLFTNQLIVPIAMVAVVIMAKVIAYLSYKYYWYHGLEKKPRDKTTILIDRNTRRIKRLIISLFIPLTSLYLLLCINGALERKIQYIGYLPLEFALLIPIALVGLPFYLHVLNNPNRIKSSMIRVVCYSHFIFMISVSWMLMKIS